MGYLIADGSAVAPGEADASQDSPADQGREAAQERGECEISTGADEESDDAEQEENDAQGEREGCAEAVEFVQLADIIFRGQLHETINGVADELAALRAFIRSRQAAQVVATLAAGEVVTENGRRHEFSPKDRIVDRRPSF